MNRREIERMAFIKSLAVSLSVVGFLWVIKLLEIVLDTDLGYFGIYPKTLMGLLGILTSVFVHGSIEHLLSNTFTLLTLIFGLYYFYRAKATEILIWLTLISQFWVWMIARPAFHIGASGVIYALFGFILVSGLIRRQREHLALAAIVLFLYGGMLAGIAPTEPHISWESHLMGFMAGIFFAFYYRDLKLYGIIVSGWDIADGEDSSGNISTTYENPYVEFRYTTVSKDEEENDFEEEKSQEEQSDDKWS